MEESKGFELKVRDLWLVLKNCWILMLAALVLVTGLTFIVMKVRHVPEYTATVTIWALRVSSDEVSGPTTQDVSVGTYLINDYKLLIEDDRIVNKVREQTNFADSTATLRSMVDIRNEQNTRVLYFSVTARDPKRAAEIANAWGTIFCAEVNNDLDSNQTDGHTPEMIKVFAEAEVPKTESNPLSFWKMLLIGLACALAVYAVYLILYILDDKITTPDDVTEYLGLNVLGAIPDKTTLRRSRTRDPNP